MNETQCTQLIESVEWTEPKNLISLAILGFINILVIVGNCLVIAAVFCSHKLRSVTNFFIGKTSSFRSKKENRLKLLFYLSSEFSCCRSFGRIGCASFLSNMGSFQGKKRLQDVLLSVPSDVFNNLKGDVFKHTNLKFSSILYRTKNT